MAILTAPLQLAQPRWTSEDVAKFTGASQSAVARTWRKHFAHSAMAEELPLNIFIHGFTYFQGHSFISAFESSPNPHLPEFSEAQFMRSPRRIPLQTMLSTQVLSSHRADLPAAVNLPHNFFAPEQPHIIIGTCPELGNTPLSSRYVYIPSSKWQGLLPYLVHAAHNTPARDLQELHQQLIVWAQSGDQEFTWNASHDLLSDSARNAAASHQRLRSSQQVIADDVFETIVELIWSGKLTAGDRITESSLARKLHTTRNQTRDALRSLASAGLVDHHPVRGVLVPSPRQSDIADIYAARRALGSEIIRRIIENPHVDISPINEALDELRRIGKTGNSYASGNADLHLQDIMGTCSGMRNIPQMFEVLAKQLRLYITVLGMTYLYSIEAMIDDDVNLYRHLVARDQAKAIARWNSKIDDAVQFMMNHVNKE